MSDLIRNDIPEIDSKRVFVRYLEEGGAKKSGLIELRRKVDDIFLSDGLEYEMVLIKVDNDLCMAGIATYSDDIPEGYDIVLNTHKERGTPPKEIFKPFMRVTSYGTVIFTPITHFDLQTGEGKVSSVFSVRSVFDKYH